VFIYSTRRIDRGLWGFRRTIQLGSRIDATYGGTREGLRCAQSGSWLLVIADVQRGANRPAWFFAQVRWKDGLGVGGPD
jgi:hypothetical protein